MVGRPYDCLTNPLGAVRFTFEKAVASDSDPASLNGVDWGVTDLFREFLFDNGGLSLVPTLNPSTVQWVQPNSLVRFRGMMQDMLGNELYVGAYKNEDTWNTNKFTDVSQFPMGHQPDMRIWERRLLYCVPVPGQNSWADPTSEAMVSPCTNFTSPNREKRQRDTSPVSGDVDMHDMSNELPTSPRAKKMREGDFSPSGAVSSVLPALDNNDFACLVKMYDCPECDLKLNDVFEFIGIVTFDSEVKDDKGGDNELTDCFPEDELVKPPPSKVPRLHCLVHRKLSVGDMILSSPPIEPNTHLVKGIREALLRHLTVVLGEDRLAAQFMLLHLLSKVHSRVDSFAVGKLSLNLTSFNRENMSVFGDRINDAVKNLVPFTHRMPLTVEYLNTVSLAPVKDYQTNRLLPGALQLAEGSHLTIDETLLQAGTLNSNGVGNTILLRDLMESQKVEYDFKYYKLKMDADVQILILSEGKSNILPADLVLPFRPASVDPLDIMGAETLNAWRWYLGTLRSLPHSIDAEMEKVVEDDLVAARKADRSLDSKDFSRWLTMGRIMSVSFGEKCLSVEHWEMVKEMEKLRKERLH